VNQATERRLPIGAEVQPGGVHFRVRATRSARVDVDIDGERVAMEREDGGYFSRFVADAGAGTRYAFRLDGGPPLPDPATRHQPDGPHGRSCVVDPDYAWTDAAWRGVPAGRQVIYELHVGTFTRSGTWAAATTELDVLAELGIGTIELMPIAEFAGRFGWGYDGVQHFAPYHHYGTPRDVRAFVDRAHALGIAVLLDVVYNHFGPDGNYLPQFAPEFFSARYRTDWGEALNFDGPGCEGAREYVLSNVAYWIDEFHFDGLRLDATQSIFDASDVHILTDVCRTARAAAHPRRVFVCGENEPQSPVLLRPVEHGGYGLDALWNDDFHHSARVALTGVDEAYYTDYRGSPQELVSAVTRGWLYQGQYYSWQKNRRGEAAADIDPRMFVLYLQNHDQVANSLSGRRLHELTDAGSLRALTAVLLLAPSHAHLFQGQEYAAPQPFLYFADHAGELGAAVASGREEFLMQFETMATPAARATLANPGAERTFEQSRLDAADRRSRMPWFALHRDLIALSRTDPVLRDVPGGVAGAIIASRAFVLRWSAPDGGRLLIVNLGPRLQPRSLAEPLVAPPAGARWELAWSSEDVAYGGRGTPPVETERGWNVPARAAVLLVPHPTRQEEQDAWTQR
jgi:maltooligosyltrehalose trehalohydrolase